MSQKNKNILIGGLLAIVLVMAVGYAAFATQLNISGSANVTSTWDVHIKSITAGTPVGTAVSKSATVGESKLTANFETDLVAPGDSLTYTVTVENGGTLDAKLSELTFTPGSSAAITYSSAGIAKDDVIAAGATKAFTVTVTYNASVTSQPAQADTTSSLAMVMSFVQNK